MSSMYLLSTATVMAAEETHSINEELHAMAPVFGAVAFTLFVLGLLVALSFAPRGKSPEVGEYQDPAQLPADEQAMLDSVHAAPRH
ncbi:hypothetical protein [Kocuria tytonis]|uniref:Uncharacterized protein n=1 Tax=Kocuria tytonis TaxID=2054280 RepID=A0A495A8Z2_9MICC|nr:hypothetical protein [Kocuria tytonis]RKQ36521.1 hypothetical protein C1C97_002360 [Kocuria tytonis]